MLSTVPPAVKAADLGRFAQRAAQVQKPKPVVAYWCNYWIIQQILAKQIHHADSDSMNYTVKLMEELEHSKEDLGQMDAMVDESAARDSIEQFGQETFQRADNAMKADKASRQTADTFAAAATFLEVSQIWGPLNPEIASKVKFAKYHALRIAKAIKAGEDPNISNPAPELPPTLQQFDAPTSEDPRIMARQPSVEEVTDEHDEVQPRLAERSTRNESLHPSRTPSVQPQFSQHEPPPRPYPTEDYYQDTAPADVSPMSAERRTSTGGGYFPSLPQSHIEGTLPEVPPFPPELMSSDSLPPPANSLHSFPPPTVEDSYALPPPTLPASYRAQPPPAHPSDLSYSSQASISNRLGPRSTQSHLPQSSNAPPRQDNLRDDEESMLVAQKHAKYAISALNFEDVQTAVRELREALEALGAR